MSDNLFALVRERVASGRYADPETVIEQAVRLLQTRDKLDDLRALVAEADDEFERGEVVEWTPEMFDQLRLEAAEAAQRGEPLPAHVHP